MPLDTSTYSLALLRVDGRRWNELRRIRAQISIQAAADGSSYLEMGNTKVLCTVSGPAEIRRGATSGAAIGGVTIGGEEKASVSVEVSMAEFSSVDRKKRTRADKRISELQQTLSTAFSSTLFTHLYPRSTITISLHILTQDGATLAACLNASTLALIDAGIPSSDYLVACTAGSTSSYVSNDESADPLLDLNSTEEQELPFLTAATLGESDEVSILVMETRVQLRRMEAMLAVAVDGCKQVRQILDASVRQHGKHLLETVIR